MKRIKQRHRTSCGVACFAMVTGISYNKSIKKVHPRRKPGSFLTTNALKLIKALWRTGHELDYYDNDEYDIRDINNKAILIIRQESYGHAVVWCPESKRILDPSRTKALNIKTYNKCLIYVIEIKN